MINDASMKVLEDFGVLFLNDVALQVFEQHGCDLTCDSKRVQMGSCFCNGTAGEGALTNYFNLVTSLLILLRAAMTIRSG